MPTFLVILRGESPLDAVPVMATEDAALVAAALGAISGALAAAESPLSGTGDVPAGHRSTTEAEGNQGPQDTDVIRAVTC